MNKQEYYLRLERAIDFVEKNINKPIDLADISEYAFSSLSHFHRIFYFMTGLTLKEYIRQRRLSNAAIQLLESKQSILDIAYQAQFETPESFNKAFKKHYRLSPNEFRKKQSEFTIMRKLELPPSEEIVQPENIVLQFVYLPLHTVMGLKTRTTLENAQQAKDIPLFFQKVMQNNLLASISNSSEPHKIVGVYSDMTDEEEFDYTVGLLVHEPVSDYTDFTVHRLPAGEYARFTVQGNPSQLENAWRYIYGRWMPMSGRSRQKGFDFEIYFPDKTDIYIPMQSE